MSSILNIVKRSIQELTMPPVARAVRREGLTYLDRQALSDLYRHVKRIEQNGIEGNLVEAGCALGGSAIVIAKSKKPDRPFYVYDVFGMIPAPSERDGADVHERFATIMNGRSTGIHGEIYYGYKEGLYDEVRSNFLRHSLPLEKNNIHLVKGLFQDTMDISWPVALAHIDGDWYDSVMTCLERITPLLSPGGTLVIDDYFHWSGCQMAVDDYFKERKSGFDFIKGARLHIIKH